METMWMKYRCVVWLGVLLLFVSCGGHNPTSNDTNTSGKGFAIPQSIQTAAIDPSCISAWITIGTSSRVKMLILNNVAFYNQSGLSVGQHQITVEFECDHVVYNVVTLAKATKVFDLHEGENVLEYSASEYDYPDNDDDKINNLNELANGTNPNNADNTPPTTIAQPAGGSYTSAVDVTFVCQDTGGGQCTATYFTRDGSIPTQTPANLFDGNALTIDTSTTLRFFSIDSAGNVENYQNNEELYNFTVQSSPFEKVALSGEAAAGTFGSYSSFSDLRLNAFGSVAFYSLASLRDGIWHRDINGNMSLAAIRSAAAPGLTGITFGDVRNFFILNNIDQLVFGSALQGTGVDTSNDLSLWLRDTSGAVSLLLREGDIAAQWPGSVPYTGFFDRFDLNNQGVIAFTASVNLGPGPVGDVIRDGVWLRDSAGVTSLVAKYDDPAPGTGSVFIAFNQTHLTDTGEFIFEARAGGGLDFGVWSRSTTGILSKLAFEGDPAVGISGAVLGAATNSTPLMRASVNNAGDLALFSMISGATVDLTNDHAIWYRSRTGVFSLVVREGDNIPGTEIGVTFASLINTDSEPVQGVPLINNSERIVFSANLAGVNVSRNAGIWYWDGASLTEVLRKGNSIVGSGLAVIGSIEPEIQLSDADEVLATVVLSGSGVGANNDEALIRWNAVDGARLFLREGDSFTVASGDSRIISTNLTPGVPGTNKVGQINFALQFTDGSSGNFIWTPN